MLLPQEGVAEEGVEGEAEGVDAEQEVPSKEVEDPCEVLAHQNVQGG